MKYFTKAEMSRGPLFIQPQENFKDLETSKQCYIDSSICKKFTKQSAGIALENRVHKRF